MKGWRRGKLRGPREGEIKGEGKQMGGKGVERQAKEEGWKA